MVEGGGREIPEDQLIDALMFGHDQIRMIVDKIEELKAQCGRPKFEYTPVTVDEGLKAKVTALPLLGADCSYAH